MAQRQTAAQRAAEASAAEEAARNAAGNQLPAAWGGGDVEEFYGHDVTDKLDLIGQPFLIIGAQIVRNERQDPDTGEMKVYDGAYVYALDTNGTEFEIYDTSESGVRGQVQGILAEQGLNPAPGGDYQALKRRVVIWKGLRFSDFEIPDPKKPGKMRAARTYYLSAAGRKPDENPGNEG